MPVKVRCECGAGISAPDAARGKLIKCKKCGGRVRVPKGKGNDAGGKPRRRKKAAAPRPAVEDDDFFSQIDLERGEDQSVRICPKCAAEVDEEELECPECGVNIDTAVLSTKQKKKRKRRGPPLEEFPREIWSSSLAFVKKNKSVVFRLLMTFTFFSTIFCVSLFMAADWCMPEDPSDPETPIKLPVTIFWSFVTLLSFGASMGCFWQLFQLVVRATTDGKDSLGRYNLDFFIGVSLGYKIVFWPMAVMGIIVVPVGSVIGLLSMFDVVTLTTDQLKILGIVAGVLYVLPIWTFPVAMSHISAQYTYRAYIPHDVFRFGFESIKGVCAWWGVAVSTMLPALGTVAAVLYFRDRLYLELGNVLLKLVEVCQIDTAEDKRGLVFMLVAAPIGITLIAIIMALLGALLCFSAVFVMRATGLFSLYYQKELGLGEKRLEEVPAGFWIRYLALMVDILLVSIFVGLACGVVFGMVQGSIYLEMEIESTLYNVMRGICVIVPIIYFILGESSSGRGSLGMIAVGLIITDLEGNTPISAGAAVTRLITRPTLLVGAFTMLKDPELQTMHDKISKTRVIWRKLNH